MGLAQGPGQRHDPEHAREPGDPGAQRDVGGGGGEGEPRRAGAQPVGPWAAWEAAVRAGQCRSCRVIGRGPRARRRPLPPRAGPPDQQDEGGQTGQRDADEGDGGGVHGQGGAGDDELAVGRGQGDADGEPVARGARAGLDAHRGGGAVEGQGARVAVGKAELVAVQREDHLDRERRRGEDRDRDGRGARGEGDGALGGQGDEVDLVAEALGEDVEGGAALGRVERPVLRGQQKVGEFGEHAGCRVTAALSEVRWARAVTEPPAWPAVITRGAGPDWR